MSHQSLPPITEHMAPHEIRAEWEALLGDKAIPGKQAKSDGWVECWALSRPKGDKANAAFNIKHGGYSDKGAGNETLDLVAALVKYGGKADATAACRDLLTRYPRPTVAKPKNDSPRRIIKTYVYRTKSGDPLFEVVRYEPKDFRPRRKEGGTYRWDLKGITPVPYCLPELIEATANDLVFIVEGEKDVETLQDMGFVATTNQGGSENWKAEFGDYFSGLNVVVIPDNDEAGESHLRRVLKSLDGKASSIKVLRLPGLPQKGDVSNWKEAGGTESDLRKLVTDCPLWSAGEEDAEEEPDCIGSMSFDELLSSDCTIEWHVPEFLAKGQNLIIAGASKTLKTTVMLDIALSIASGTSCLGNDRWKASKAAVGVISAESGQAVIKETVARIAKSKGISAAVAYFSFELPQLTNPDDLERVRRWVEKKGLSVVVFDPAYLMLLDAAASSGAGNVFSMGAALRGISNALKGTGVTVILLHHSTKSAARASVLNAEPLSLEDMSQAGFAEFARQWILISRREKWDESGTHLLWMSFGGSAGHGGIKGLDIVEGRRTDPGGRKWSVEVRDREAVESEVEKRREAVSEGKKSLKTQDHKVKIRIFLREHGPCLKDDIRNAGLGIRNSDSDQALGQMYLEGEVERVTVKRAGRDREAYKLRDPSHFNGQATIVGPDRIPPSGKAKPKPPPEPEQLPEIPDDF